MTASRALSRATTSYASSPQATQICNPSLLPRERHRRTGNCRLQYTYFHPRNSRALSRWFARRSIPMIGGRGKALRGGAVSYLAYVRLECAKRTFNQTAHHLAMYERAAYQRAPLPSGTSSPSLYKTLPGRHRGENGAPARRGDAGPPSAQFLPKKYYNEARNITAKGRANPACSPDRPSHAGDASSGRTAPPIITAPCAIHGRGLALPSAPLHAPAAQRFGGEAGQLLISVS